MSSLSWYPSGTPVMCCGLFILSNLTGSGLLAWVSHLHKEGWTLWTLCCLCAIHHHYDCSCRTSSCDSGSVSYTTFPLLDAIQVNIPVGLNVSPGIDKADYETREWKWQVMGEESLTFRFLLRAFGTGRVPLFLAIVEVYSEPDNIVTETHSGWLYKCSPKPQLQYWFNARGSPQYTFIH